MKTLVCLLLISSCISDTLAAILSSPGAQGKPRWGRCTFQWRVSLPLGRYNVYNLTTGSSLPLSRNANYTADEQNGIVTLNIWNIQLWDAGNYTLSMTNGTNTHSDSGALLIVYAPVSMVFINQTSAPNPASVGQKVEFTCTVLSNSFPIAYRPKVYYTWYVNGNSELKNVSGGPAEYRYGGVIKNNGSTLVIDPVERGDASSSIRCSAQEEGSPYNPENSSYFSFQVLSRPYVTYRNPDSGILNADFNRGVWLYINGVANPIPTSATSWTFVDTAGRTQQLPPNAVPYYYAGTWFYFRLYFNLTSENFFGNYSVAVTNILGSISETIQVRPPGPPDAPSKFDVLYVSHEDIALQWTVSWDNGYAQTIHVQANAADNATVLGEWNYSNYNFTQSYNLLLSNNIRPETEYEVRISSTNILGSSDVVKLTTRTLKQPILFVSPETISFIRSEAMINYTMSYGNLTSLSVSWCINETRNGFTRKYIRDFQVSSNEGQIVISDLPDGCEYVFDFTANVRITKSPRNYVIYVNGLRVSINENGICSTTPASTKMLSTSIRMPSTSIKMLSTIIMATSSNTKMLISATDRNTGTEISSAGEITRMSSSSQSASSTTTMGTTIPSRDVDRSAGTEMSSAFTKLSGTSDMNGNRTPVATIVLACLFGFAVLVIIVSLAVLLPRKCRTNVPPKQTGEMILSKVDASEQESQMENPGYNAYESADVNASKVDGQYSPAAMSGGNSYS